MGLVCAGEVARKFRRGSNQTSGCELQRGTPTIESRILRAYPPKPDDVNTP